MIKGILALFKTGVIFNPFVLTGVLCGFVLVARLDAEGIRAFYLNYHVYLLLFLLGAGYNFMFKKEYKDNGDDIDYTAMFGKSLLCVVKFIFSSIMAIAFVGLLSF